MESKEQGTRLQEHGFRLQYIQGAQLLVLSLQIGGETSRATSFGGVVSKRSAIPYLYTIPTYFT